MKSGIDAISQNPGGVASAREDGATDVAQELLAFELRLVYASCTSSREERVMRAAS